MKRMLKDGDAVFFKAAAKGDVAKLKALMAAGQDVEARDQVGRTALMRAAEGAHIATARTLLAAGADAKAAVSDRDALSYGCNALLFAAESGNEEMVELLIKAGASPKCETADGSSPLSFAVEGECERMVEMLLKAGAPLAKDILVTSLWKSSPKITLRLIEAGANVDAADELDQTVLHRAAETGELEIVRALIGKKAKLNRAVNHRTPLFAAIERGRPDCALELIQAGADDSLGDAFGQTPLMRAALLKQPEVVRALLKAGANPNDKDKTGKTALMLVNEKNYTAMVELLRQAGCDEAGFKVQEYIRAAEKGDVECVRRLLEEGVDVNATYQNGAKALPSAAKKGHTKVVEVLIQFGVDVNTRVGRTVFDELWIDADALALAASEGHLDIVRLLIKAGADVNRSEMLGTSALTIAAEEGHADVVRELLKAGLSLKGGVGVEALESTLRKRKEEAAVALVAAGVKPRAERAANLLVDAAKNGMARLVRALLERGIDPKRRNEDDETALEAAKSMGHSAIVAMLEKAGSPQASPGMELIEAAESGDLKVVHRLILEGVDLETRDGKGGTALIRASANGHVAVMKALLTAGADSNASTPVVKRRKNQPWHRKLFQNMELASQTPLSGAVSLRSLPAVELLLAAGADIRKTECGHLACMILQEGTTAGAVFVERLLDAGMDPNARWPDPGVSALEIAAQEGFTRLVKKLIEAGARLKTPLERDRTVMEAIQSEEEEIARILIEQGIAEMKGKITPKALVEAAAAGLDDIVRLLLKRGITVDQRIDTSFDSRSSAEGVTALMGAARHGRESTAELLLQAGADPKAEDAVGRTALDWAEDHKNAKVRQRICRLIESATGKQRA